LAVQSEIVRILDKFTLYKSELAAELAARLQQYEYYRDQLLTFDDTVKRVKLGEVAEIGTGSSNTNEGKEEGLYPFYVRSQTPLRKDTYEYDETAIITAGDGVGVGKVFHFVNGKYALHQRAYRIHPVDTNILPKYLFYYMRTTFEGYIHKTMFHSSVSSIRRPMLVEYPIPLPPLSEQERIVSILDRFDKLCHDIREGLPAEIDLRQKQYEHYRDKLLTFEAKG
jgi:type I restriction enzyme S subunit